jgi:hypothetical protein
MTAIPHLPSEARRPTRHCLLVACSQFAHEIGLLAHLAQVPVRQ